VESLRARQNLPVQNLRENPDVLVRERILSQMKNQNIISRLLLCGTVLLSMTACRFGNHSDSPTQINKTTISNSELYFTSLTKFETKVYFNDNTVVSNSNSPLVAAPSSLLEVFTNPVYWLTLNDGTQYFWDNQGASYPLQTLADASGRIQTSEYNPPTGVATFYKNPNCVTLIETLQDGTFDRTAPAQHRERKTKIGYRFHSGLLWRLRG
jgi:hypothetical protein